MSKKNRKPYRAKCSNANAHQALSRPTKLTLTDSLACKCICLCREIAKMLPLSQPAYSLSNKGLTKTEIIGSELNGTKPFNTSD